MAFLVLLAIAGSLGTIALRPLALHTDIEGFVLRFFTGFVLCAIVIVAFGAGSLRAALAAILILGGTALTLELFVLRRTPRSEPPKPAKSLTTLDTICVAVTGAALWFTLIGALAPVTNWDAGVAHLAVPAAYTYEGRMTLLEGHAYSAFPQLLHALITMALYLGSETSAALLSWTFGVLSCGAAFALGQRIAGRSCGLLSAAILATAPIFIDQAGTVTLDLAFSGLTLAAMTALFAWRDERRLAWLLLAGFLAGSACGIRHTGYLCGVLLLVGVAVCGTERRIPAIALFALMLGLGAVPWLLRSALLTGNPVYPFFMAQLSPDVLPDIDITAPVRHESVQQFSLFGFLTFPWSIVMKPHLHDGWMKSPGPWVLVLGLPGLFLGGRRVRALALYAIAGGACLYFLRHYARYYLPFFAPMMVVAAAVACRLPFWKRTTAILLVATFAFGIALHAAAVHFKVPVVLRRESREAYLANRVERYEAFTWVSDVISGKEMVLTLDPRCYYIKGRSYGNFEALKGLVDRPYAEQLAWLRERDIHYVLIPIEYMENSPGHRETGVLQLVWNWRRQEHDFRLMHAIENQDAHGQGSDRVEILKVHYPNLAGG
jgi:hypothetical protein